MKDTSGYELPQRVTEIVDLKRRGFEVTCRTSFEIVPVDFRHRDNAFKAYIFLCRYDGEVNGRPYQFRKCYARGCDHNRCPQVSQAVMIANRYLQRDYHRLEEAGIAIDKQLFSLEEMTVKFDKYQQQHDTTRVIHDYLEIARHEADVSVRVTPEFVPAVEHFAHESHPQVFLMVDFEVTYGGKVNNYERCLSCYPAEEEKERRSEAVAIANERLRALYDEFDRAGIKYDPVFFD